MKQSIVGDISFCLLTWSDLEKITNDLASQIVAQNVQFDRLVAVANGGLTMVRQLADRLGSKNISLLQISSYQGVAEHDPEPVLLQPLTSDVQGEKLLIFEDIVDTGSTLLLIDKYLPTLGVASYQIAAQVEKDHTTRQADFVGQRLNDWAIFPYETKETIRDLSAKWMREGKQPSQIKYDLATIGFDVENIDLFSEA